MNKELISRLSAAFGVAGRENCVRDIIAEEIKPYCDSLRIDALGSLIAEKRGGGELLLTAPMDEPGFIITGIREGGGAFLNFAPVGRIRPSSVVSEAVVVGDKAVPGVISLKAVHLSDKEEREKPVALKDLFIDIGADTREKAESMVMIGDYAGFMSRPREIGGLFCNKAAGRAALCAALIELMRTETNIACVFTAQSGVGMRGAKTDFGIEGIRRAVTLGCIEDKTLKPGCGAVLPMMINESLPDYSMSESLRSIDGVTVFGHKAEDGDITAVNIKGCGVCAAELDIAVKNRNTSSEIIDPGDIETLINVLRRFIGGGKGGE